MMLNCGREDCRSVKSFDDENFVSANGISTKSFIIIKYFGTLVKFQYITELSAI